ncbi:MAG TPA: ankyrin repeat domain-containing protein [Pyrinomonadaceae bacterium]|nr:ankyrin repeat domain-containing protein [Pyrinomonadaceae bacterium]
MRSQITVPRMTRGRMFSVNLQLLLVLVGLVALTSCQNEAAHSDPENAKRKLTEKNIEFSRDAFVKSIREGSVEAVKLFLDAGMDVESKDESGSTVLMNAAIKNDSSVVQLLIDHGADVNARTKDGETPLMIAALMGGSDTVKILLKAGADMNARDKRGETPLAHARSHSHTEVIALLKAAGAEE